MNKLSFLNGWANIGNYFTHRSAQSYFGATQLTFATSGCGAGDDVQPQPSACGASDDGDSKPQPSACGVGDDGSAKPSSCGTGDGK